MYVISHAFFSLPLRYGVRTCTVLLGCLFTRSGSGIEIIQLNLGSYSNLAFL